MSLPTNLTDALRYQRGTQRGDEVWKELAAKEIAELKREVAELKGRRTAFTGVGPSVHVDAKVAEQETPDEPVLSTTVDISTVEPSA